MVDNGTAYQEAESFLRRVLERAEEGNSVPDAEVHAAADRIAEGFREVYSLVGEAA